MSDDLDLADLDQAPDLVGTVTLARAALTSPAPSEEAEARSRREVETRMREGTLSPRLLRQADAPLRPQAWWERFVFWKR